MVGDLREKDSNLRAVSEAVPLERWRAIVERAVRDALKGDHQARVWLERLLIGAEPAKLSEALAGVLHGGENDKVAAHLDQLVRDADEAEEDEDFFNEDRRERVEALVKTLDEPDPAA